MEENQTDALTTIRECCQALDDKKALDVRLLNVTGKSSITNYFIIASGTSEPHLRALRRSIEEVLKKGSTQLVGVEHQAQSGWMCLDAFDFMIHLFLPRQRDTYQLEQLWKDAEEVPVAELLSA